MFRNVDLGDWGQAAGSESTVSTAAKECGVSRVALGFPGVTWGGGGGNVGHAAAAKEGLGAADQSSGI